VVVVVFPIKVSFAAFKTHQRSQQTISRKSGLLRCLKSMHLAVIFLPRMYILVRTSVFLE